MRDKFNQLIRVLSVAEFMRRADNAPYRFRLGG